MKKRLMIYVVMIVALAMLVLPALATDYTGTIENTDPSQLGRLNRNGVEATCAAPKAYPGDFAAGVTFHYDTHTYTNNDTVTICVSVEFTTPDTTNSNIYVAAFLETYDPANKGATYLADGGSSTGSPPTPVTFSFNLDPGATAVFVIYDTIGQLATPHPYTITVLPDEIVAVPPVTALNVPHVANIRINAGSNVPAYDGPAGSQVKLLDGTDVFLPADYDNNGFDTYVVTDTAVVEGVTWYSIFLGDENFVWVNGSHVILQ